MRTAADIVIERFGGLTATAKALANGVTRQAVWGWWERGAVPIRRVPEVVAAARRLGIRLSAEELTGVAAAADKGGEL